MERLLVLVLVVIITGALLPSALQQLNLAVDFLAAEAVQLSAKLIAAGVAISGVAVAAGLIMKIWPHPKVHGPGHHMLKYGLWSVVGIGAVAAGGLAILSHMGGMVTTQAASHIH